MGSYGKSKGGTKTFAHLQYVVAEYYVVVEYYTVTVYYVSAVYDVVTE